LRERQTRNFLTTLLLSQGVPMLLGGDELGRTQRGNNNAYCQDNEISWFDWSLDGRRQRLLEFTNRVIRLREAHPVFRRAQFLTGESQLGSGLPDSWWFRTDGRKMTRRDWGDGGLRTIGLFLNGSEIPSRTPAGELIVDDSFVVLINASAEPTAFLLPPRRFGSRWALELSTADPDARGEWPARAEVEVEGRSVVLLRRDGR
jgi:glycogen operon protein